MNNSAMNIDTATATERSIASRPSAGKVMRGILSAAVLGFLTSYFTSSAQSYSSALADETFPQSVFWGNLHLHTTFSADAFEWGNRSLGPEEAYRFAIGEPIASQDGSLAKIGRPLDFLAVTDHAEYLGFYGAIVSGDPELKGLPHWAQLKGLALAEEELKDPSDATRKIFKDVREVYSNDYEFAQSAWHKTVAAADKYYQPGEFTTFIGYEWSAWGAQRNSLHRVVIFNGDSEGILSIKPFSGMDSNQPERLWAFLESYEAATGGNALAIPHNGNLSNGSMFPPFDSDGDPLSRSYAETRSKWEPLFEVTQIKGDSEAHPSLSPEDQFADFELFEWTTHFKDGESRFPGAYDGSNEARQREYARPALKLGLSHQAEIGINPFKFGMIGSTDAHNALTSAEEDNFWGKTSFAEPSINRIRQAGLMGWNMAAAGYAAIWAEENTREALFAAMKRRETYASTGPRMEVRFFGGWSYEADVAFRPDLARIGYANGVPMGGDLTAAPDGASPRFLIRAVKDPIGANLDRVQVIKGWQSKDGALHEEVYDVAVSDGRKIRPGENVEPVGSTVNVEDASYTNEIGDPELSVVWTDPNFNRDELAFYYERVLEIPTPRWTAYDAKYFGISEEAIPDDVPMTLQERAYTSPIWYSPQD